MADENQAGVHHHQVRWDRAFRDGVGLSLVGMMFQNLVLTVGAMKAGTSWLYMNLRNHPDVDCLPIKESHYFWDVHGNFRALSGEQRINNIAYNLPRILSHTEFSAVGDILDWFKKYVERDINDPWFLNLFDDHETRRWCADFSNLYALLQIDAWRHARELSNNTRIIYMLRDPIKRLWSHARFHALFTNEADACMDWDSAQFSSFITKHGLLQHGNYADTILRLYNSFEHQDIKLLYFEDIIKEPLRLMRDVENHLGIACHQYDPGTLSAIHNGSRFVEAPSAFYRAAVPMVEPQILDMQKASIPVQEDWLYTLHEIRRRFC